MKKFGFIKIISIAMLIGILLVGCSNKVPSSLESKDDENETENTSLSYMDFDTSCITKLGEYKTGTLEKDISVTDIEIIETYFESIETTITNSAEESEDKTNPFEALYITEGTVNEFDIICFDFEGYTDGEKFSGGTATNQFAIMGAGHFIPGFEEQIIGGTIGTQFDINVTFPAGYSADLAGKDAVFKILVHYVVPGITEETVAIINELASKDYKSAQEYKNAIRDELKKQKDDDFNDYFLSNVLQKIYNASEISELPKTETDSMYAQIDANAEQYGVDRATFMYYMYGISGEDQITEYVNYQVGLKIIIAKIVQLEKFEISSDLYNTTLAEYAKAYGYEDVREFEEMAGKNIIKNMIYVDLLEDFLKTNWTVTVKE